MTIEVLKLKYNRPLCSLRYIDGKPVAYCVYSSAGQCRGCGRYRDPAPAIGVMPEGTSRERLEVEI